MNEVFETAYKAVKQRSADNHALRTLYCSGSSYIALDALKEIEGQSIIKRMFFVSKCLIVTKGTYINDKFVKRNLSLVTHKQVTNDVEFSANNLEVSNYVNGIVCKNELGEVGYFVPQPNSLELSEGVEFNLVLSVDTFKLNDYVKRTIKAI